MEEGKGRKERSGDATAFFCVGFTRGNQYLTAAPKGKFMGVSLLHHCGEGKSGSTRENCALEMKQGIELTFIFLQKRKGFLEG